MRRIINYGYIDNKVLYIKRRLIELNDIKDKLNKDILLLENSFKGQDGDLHRKKYISKISSIEKYIENIKKYIEYFDWLSSSYKDIQYRTKMQLSENLNVSNDSFEYEDFYDWGEDGFE